MSATPVHPPSAQGILLPWYHRFRVDLPPMRRGDWRLVVDDVKSWRCDEGVLESWKGVRVPKFAWPGEYRVLQRHEYREVVSDPHPGFEEPYRFGRWEWKTWMADSPVEIATQLAAIRRLRGRVLIGGLGLGVLVKAALMRRDVERVDILEIDTDIIAMVGPHYADRRVRIIQEDALTFEPTGRSWYDVVYMDIWRDIGACNLLDMIKLRRRWVDRCGWYGAWSEDRAMAQLKLGTVLNPKNAAFALEVFERYGLRRSA